jgi:hypothetical protein
MARNKMVTEKHPNYINYIFFFTCKKVPHIKIIYAHKHGQVYAAKQLKAEFGDDIRVSNVLLEGEQLVPQKSLPPIFTNVENKE